MRIPLSAPDITDAEIAAVTQVLRSGRLSLGPQLEAFESAIAQYTGTKHAVGVSSGTAGLHLAIRALGLKEGDEVVLPSFTFIAAANVLHYERITPVFVDIDSVERHPWFICKEPVFLRMGDKNLVVNMVDNLSNLPYTVHRHSITSRVILRVTREKVS